MTLVNVLSVVKHVESITDTLLGQFAENLLQTEYGYSASLLTKHMKPIGLIYR